MEHSSMISNPKSWVATNILMLRVGINPTPRILSFGFINVGAGFIPARYRFVDILIP